MIPAVYGGFWRRAAAILVDKVILLALCILLFFIGLMANLAAAGSSQILEDLLLGNTTVMTGGFIFLYYITILLLSIIYFGYFIGYAGQTPGKMLFGLYVIRVSGENMNFRQAFIRWIGYILSGMVFYIGFLWAIFDRRKQGWHDKLAGSIVIHIPRDRIIPSPPEPPKSKREEEIVPPEKMDSGQSMPDEDNQSSGQPMLDIFEGEKYLDKEKGI